MGFFLKPKEMTPIDGETPVSKPTPFYAPPSSQQQPLLIHGGSSAPRSFVKPPNPRGIRP